MFLYFLYWIFGLEGMVFIFINLLSIVFFLLLYLLQNRSHILLSIMDIIFAFIYGGIVNILLGRRYLSESKIEVELLKFIIPFIFVLMLMVFVIIPGIILFIKKIRGKDIYFLSKIFMHGIVACILIILFSTLFSTGVFRTILYYSSCDTNFPGPIISGSKQRISALVGQCIELKAREQNNPLFCDKLNKLNKKSNEEFDFWYDFDVNSCKMRVAFEAIEFGDLSLCSYLKSEEGVVLNTFGGKDAFEKCATR